MSKLTFLAIACGFMVAGAGLAAWRHEAPAPEQKSDVPTEVPANAPLVAAGTWTAAAPAPVAELDPDADTTGLLLESPTVDEFLEMASAASAEPLGDADRDRLETLIRSDPELRKQFRK